MKTHSLEGACRLFAWVLGWCLSVVGLAQGEGSDRAWFLDQQLSTPSVLVNGGFENEAELGAWELTSNTPPQRSEHHVHSGRFSLHSKLVNDGPQPSEGHLRQTVPKGIVGGERYALEFWVREIDFGISYVQQYAVTWLDAAGEELREGAKGLTNFRAGKKDWEQVRIEGLVAPEAAQGVHLLFRFVTGAVQRGSGEVFVDDIAFLPENTELVTAVPLPAHEATLVWQNGDALAGQLLPSEGRRVTWRAPVFLDPIEVDPAALDSIRFVPGELEVASEFHLETVMGDLLAVDILSADTESYHVSSPRFGRIAIQRSAVFGLRRIENPNRTFEGTRLTDWYPVLGGPLTELSYQVHTLDADRPIRSLADFDFDFDVESLIAEGELASGFLDVGVAEEQEQCAVQFEATLAIPEEGAYEFEFAHGGMVRFWLDDELVLSSASGTTRSESLSLAAGSSTVRLEYIPAPRSEDVELWWSGPGFTKQPLSGTNRRWTWRSGKGGAPFTRLKTTGLFRTVELPESFHLDLEVESRGEPRFVMGLGRDAQRAEAEDAIRLETRGDELVLVSDTIFEPLMRLSEDQRQIRLRLTFDRVTRTLQVNDLSGPRLALVEDIDVQTGPSGVLWRNRGGDLTVQRVSVTGIENGGLREEVDATRPRVHLIDGSVHYGQLFSSDGLVEVGEAEGARRSISLSEVDRVIHPDAQLKPWSGGAAILYSGGGIVRGQLISFDDGAVRLQPRFLLEPIVCSFAGATRLQFVDSGSYRPPSSYGDRLRMMSGRVRGQLAFGMPDAPLGWSVIGADQPVRLSSGVTAQVARDRGPLSVYYAFDTDAFPSVLHLANGEAFPCMFFSYDSDLVRFESPFLSETSLPSRQVKALEFKARAKRTQEERRAKRPIRQSSRPVLAMQATLGRALTVPRIHRGQPPSHLMMAVNGDLRRGQLISVGEEAVRFESKQREWVIPRERVQAVVSIETPHELLNDNPSEAEAGTDALPVRIELVDGSVLIFRPTGFEDGRLTGQSPIYGDLSVPANQILTVDSGKFSPKIYSSKFGSWLARPAKEPSFAR